MNLCKHGSTGSAVVILLSLVHASGCGSTPQSPTPGCHLCDDAGILTEGESAPAVVLAALQRHGNMLFAPTSVNGKDVGLFLLDTGSTLNVIGQGVAARLKLPVTGQSTAIGTGGLERFLYRRARTVRFGNIEYCNTDLACLYLNRFQRPLAISMNGIIGFTSLRNQPFTIDYQVPLLTIHASDDFVPPPGGTCHRLFFVNGLPAVDARLAGNHPVTLLLDTGADNHVTLPRQLLGVAPGIISVPQTGLGQSVGIGGRTDGIQTWLSTIKIFGLQLKHVPATFTESPLGSRIPGPPIGRIGSGLLRFFRITFDPGAKVVWVLFRPHGKPPDMP